MRLGPRSAWLLLALLLPAPCWGQSDTGPDDLQAMARYWKDRQAGKGEAGATTEGVTVRVKPGQLIKLTPEPDWPAEVEWDWPEALASRDDTGRYYIDYAKRTLILPSDRPGQYRVTAWGIDKGRAAPFPEGPPMPPADAAPAKPAAAPAAAAPPAAPAPRPKRLKVWTVIVEGGTAPAVPFPEGKTTGPVTVPADLTAAVKADLQDPSNAAPLAALRAAIEGLAREAESGTTWKFSRDARKAINAAMAAVPQGKLPQTYKVILNRLTGDPGVKTFGAPATRWDFSDEPRNAFAKVLREIANGLK